MPKFSVVSPTYNQLDELKKIKPHWDAQTFKDFEWILAIDGEGEDGTLNWAKENGIKTSIHKKEGFDLSRSFNEGAQLSKGEYIILVNGDSYPQDDFLEQINKGIAENRLVCGLRHYVDDDGKMSHADWRVDRVMFPLEGQDAIQIYHPRPWELMTGSPSCFHRNVFDALDGYYEGYHGGREDWDFAMRAYYSGIKLFWIPKAVIFHFGWKEWWDKPENIELFNSRLNQIKNDKDLRTQGKIDQIMSGARAKQKLQQIKKKLAEIEKKEREFDRKGLNEG